MGQCAEVAVGSLPSARPDRRRLETAPTTFRTKGDADAFLAATRADVGRGHWIDPTAGQVELAGTANGG